MAAATSVHVVAIVEPIIQHADWFFPEGRFSSSRFQSDPPCSQSGLILHQGRTANMINIIVPAQKERESAGPQLESLLCLPKLWVCTVEVSSTTNRCHIPHILLVCVNKCTKSNEVSANEESGQKIKQCVHRFYAFSFPPLSEKEHYLCTHSSSVFKFCTWVAKYTFTCSVQTFCFIVRVYLDQSKPAFQSLYLGSRRWWTVYITGHLTEMMGQCTSLCWFLVDYWATSFTVSGQFHAHLRLLIGTNLRMDR